MFLYICRQTLESFYHRLISADNVVLSRACGVRLFGDTTQ